MKETRLINRFPEKKNAHLGKWIMDYVIIKMVPQKDMKWLNF